MRFPGIPFACLMIAACSSAGSVHGLRNDLPPDADAAVLDPGFDALFVDASVGDASPETGREIPHPACTPPASNGCPCESAGDCGGGYCAKTEDGKRCTAGCAVADAACVASAAGWCLLPWSLVKVKSDFSDDAWICLPVHPRLCRPCANDDACATHRPSVCLSYGDPGSFCATACGPDSACPEGFDCVPNPAGGDPDRVCRLASGECPCSPAAIAEASATTCFATNASGSCPGQRTCGPDGLSECDAPQPGDEVCDGLDNDCDGVKDEGFPDPDGDGLADCVDPDDDGDDIGDDEDDCPATYDPDQTDTDKDGIGDACDDDIDGDGFANSADCGPLDPSIHPGAVEVCNGRDDDCDGEVDEEGTGCKWFFPDQDGDGFGTAGAACLCGPVPPMTAASGGDCDDGNPTVHPGTVEVCNGFDDDCDGTSDAEGSEGCVPLFADGDGDGYGTGDSRCLCDLLPPWTTQKAGDCDDAVKAVHPGAKDGCNGRDDDCDGTTDEDKGTEVETCNGVDDDCDDQTDPEGSDGCTLFFEDGDKDGYGIGAAKCLCAGTGGFTAGKPGDCDDANPAIHPDAKESCNGKDDDCNGVADPEGSGGCTSFYADGDGDGYGAGAAKCLCAASGSYKVAKAGDCDDKDKAIHPGAKEVCNNKDDNCDGKVDPVGTCSTVPTRKICIDPGHGGSDPGAVANGIQEKTMNLDIGKRFRDLLNKDTSNAAGGGNWKVYMTRDTDKAVSLASRVSYANSNKVDRFMSIHNNAGGGTGTETFWYTYGSSSSKDLAGKVQAQVVAHVGSKNRGVKQANFYVLRETSMPAELLEVLFVDTTADANKLKDANVRQQAARGQLHAIQQHYGQKEFDP
jgi:N-acetylmuramoyl-L-alanine amidase